MIMQGQSELFTAFIKLLFLFGSSFFIFILQRFLQLLIGKYLAQSKKISLDMINNLKLVIRMSSLLTVFYLALVLFNFSTESIFGFSAIIGAIISFGSLQWISNFIAGVYLLLLRPFSINDFVELNEEIRGTVEELSLNYTKIKTVNGAYHYIPNKIIIRTNLMLYYGKKQRIVVADGKKKPVRGQTTQVFKQFTRYLIEERVVRYTFLWGAPLGDLLSTKRKLLEICEIYSGIFGYKPEFYLESIGYRMNFKFIVTTLNVNLLVNNLHAFRNDITGKFH